MERTKFMKLKLISMEMGFLGVRQDVDNLEKIVEVKP